MSTESLALVAYGVAAGGAVLVGFIVWLLWGVIKTYTQDVSYETQLNDLINYDDDDDTATLTHGRNFSEKWMLYWQRVGVGTGIARWSAKDNNAHKDVLVIWVILAVVVSALTGSLIFGPAAGTIAIYGITLMAKSRYRKQQTKIQDQIPGFLFAMKANIQANETPVRAILKIVDTMPEPLRSDLMVVKMKIQANSSFAEALGALVERTNSNELRFLATCLIQASSTGANIEPQLDTIQRVLEQRKRAADELAKAVRGTIPAIAISSIAIPLCFGATYFIDPTSKDFWFHGLLSWAALGVIFALWAFGMWMTHRMVEAIRNL